MPSFYQDRLGTNTGKAALNNRANALPYLRWRRALRACSS
jgi:hypothetical protein